MVNSVLYNQLGQMTEINLGNGLKTTYGYWGTGGAYDTAGGYYGKLWEIKTSKQPGSSPVLLDIKHTWDAGGNLTQREDVVATQTETFGYDFVDRLTSVSGAYTESYAYNQIGNITSKNGASYTYGTKPHAVTAVGSTSYTYDANGNMITRGAGTITWDVENRPKAISDNNTYVYDGDGKRGKKTEGGQTILYINKLYEKNITTSENTTYYFIGGNLVAMRKGTTLQYMHQDHLTGTAVMSDNTGTQVGTTMKYYPFGATRSGSVPTDVKFTGQRLDGTGLYYFNARYYDPVIGRFISADTIVPGAFSSQSLNRYSYVLNNPLKYNDPGGHDPGSSTGAGGGWGINAGGWTVELAGRLSGFSTSGILGFSVTPGTNPSGLNACAATAMASMGIGMGMSGMGNGGFNFAKAEHYSTSDDPDAPIDSKTIYTEESFHFLAPAYNGVVRCQVMCERSPNGNMDCHPECYSHGFATQVTGTAVPRATVTIKVDDQQGHVQAKDAAWGPLSHPSFVLSHNDSVQEGHVSFSNVPSNAMVTMTVNVSISIHTSSPGSPTTSLIPISNSWTYTIWGPNN
jgi:RHS repeat-associated protein